MVGFCHRLSKSYSKIIRDNSGKVETETNSDWCGNNNCDILNETEEVIELVNNDYRGATSETIKNDVLYTHYRRAEDVLMNPFVPHFNPVRFKREER